MIEQKEDSTQYPDKRFILNAAKILCELARISTEETKKIIVKEAVELLLNKNIENSERTSFEPSTTRTEESKDAKAAVNKKNIVEFIAEIGEQNLLNQPIATIHDLYIEYCNTKQSNYIPLPNFAYYVKKILGVSTAQRNKTTIFILKRP